jgi:glycosyltransferase involved in cell wall biosynthesis
VSPPPRILTLAAREPRLDPRFRWVAGLCREVAHTDFFAAVWPPLEWPEREYDGRLYLERVDVTKFATTSMQAFGGALGSLITFGPTARDIERTSRLSAADGNGSWRARIERRVGVTGRLLASYGQLRMAANALFRRSKGLSIPPAVVVCHDLPTLPVGLALRRVFGSRVVFDCHDLWSDVNPVADDWERTLISRFERRLVPCADRTVTVSPPLARHLERTYGVRDVVVSPNAEPLVAGVEPASKRPTSLPVRFVFQGGAVPGRGLDVVLETWRRLDDERAVLYLRCPESPYLADLRSRFSDLLERGRVVIVPAVASTDLVAAAASADVGVVPYLADGLNHQFACPNKLSQYMQAGLAILGQRLDFVAEVIERYRCGIVYDARTPESLAAAVTELVSDLSLVDRFKENAFAAAHSEFNWDVQSTAYRELLTKLVGGGRRP